MHVTAVTPLYPPESRVGAWLATHLLLKGVVAAGHSVEVVSSLTAGPEYVLDGVRVQNGTKWIQQAVLRADVVVSHLGDQGTAHEFAVRRGKPSVRMVHGLAPPNQLRAFKTLPVDLLVFNSHASLHAADWDGPSMVVHPPLEVEAFATTPGTHVTQVNLADAKGGQLFGKLARFMPDLMFLGVEGGYGRQRHPPMSRNVEVIGPTKNMRDDVYRRTRVLVVPSKWETWGMVGQEALCSGIPVVASPTPGLRESLGDAGVFVDTANFGGWLEAIRSLSDPVVWSEASEKALRRAQELASVDNTGRFVRALEGLL